MILVWLKDDFMKMKTGNVNMLSFFLICMISSFNQSWLLQFFIAFDPITYVSSAAIWNDIYYILQKIRTCLIWYTEFVN